MNRKWYKTFLIHSHTPEYFAKVNSALDIIRSHYISKKSYVSCSGGKDSLVLTHLCLKVDPNIIVFHWDHGSYLMPREVEKEEIKAKR